MSGRFSPLYAPWPPAPLRLHCILPRPLTATPARSVFRSAHMLWWTLWHWHSWRVYQLDCVKYPATSSRLHHFNKYSYAISRRGGYTVIPVQVVIRTCSYEPLHESVCESVFQSLYLRNARTSFNDIHHSCSLSDPHDTEAFSRSWIQRSRSQERFPAKAYRHRRRLTKLYSADLEKT